MALDVTLRHRLALGIAVGADFLQIVAFPFFAPGLSSPADDALDIAVGAALFALLGWHWSFVPAFAAELIPGFDLVPTWTASVLLALRGKRGAEAPAEPEKNVTPPARKLEP
jgi:hypothetical protein